MTQIKVYHGSGTKVTSPSLDYGRDNTDFGIGFYVTADAEMAEIWASRKRQAIINVYETDLDNLSGIIFDIDKSWLDFVIQNRSGHEKIKLDLSDIDYISGATADDKLFSVIERYEDNLLDADTAMEALNMLKIGTQIAFISDAGISSLKFKEAYELSLEKKNEIKNRSIKARDEVNVIVENLLKNKVKQLNEIPAPMPTIRRKKR